MHKNAHGEFKKLVYKTLIVHLCIVCWVWIFAVCGFVKFLRFLISANVFLLEKLELKWK